MRRYYCRDENFFGDSAAATGLKSNLPFRPELNLTPKELANFSPGFPTLGNKAVKILFTLKELRNRMELFQS